MNEIIVSDNDFPRDQNGNKIFPKVDFSWAEFNRWNATHIFHEWDDIYGGYRAIANLICDADLIEQKDVLEREKILVYKLFKMPDRPSNNHMQHHAWCRNLAYHFFKEVFMLPDTMGSLMNEFDLARIIIRKKTFDEIESLIKENNLTHIKDLIFFIIAKIGDVYLGEVEYLERPEMTKQMNNAGKEAEKLITVIDRVRPDLHDLWNKKNLPKLKNITFDFPDIEPLKIEDPLFNISIVEAIKSDFQNRPLKNWRKEVRKFAEFYLDDKEKLKYRFHVAIALHNLFSHLKTFPLKQGKASSDTELLCIAKILEFGFLKIGNEGISDAQKIRNVRNYINPKRNKLSTYSSHIEAKPNFEILEKYFEKEFLKSVLLIKHIDVVKTAIYISERFDIQHLRAELAHLIDCIQHRKNQLGWQFSTQGLPTETHPTIGSLFKLISPFRIDKDKIQLTELSFKLDNNNEIHTIKEELPLMLIERALTEYYHNHQEEFDVDILNSKIHENSQTGAFRVEELGGYKKQGERFLPTLCTNLYNFLLNEAPPEKTVASATEKYSEIIAVILQRCLVFNRMSDEEDILKQKVKQWLKEAKQNLKNNTA